MRRTSERGVTGVEILIAIAIALAVLLALWWFFGRGPSEGQVSVCRSQLTQVQRTVEAWNATTSPEDPIGDRILCTTARDAVTRYHTQCAEISGALPVPTCQ
jgi:hypothetical protein